jgi:glucokinase
MSENKSDKNDLFLGLDVGGTKCAVVLGDASFRIRQKVFFETKVERGWKSILSEFQQHIDMMLKELPEEKIKRIGISCGGPMDSKKGMIYSPPNLPGWDNVPITEIFSKKYGVPAAVQNDANACALAEWMMGAGKGTQNMIFLTFGTGMGAGLVLNGQLYAGTNDLGGEVGHIRLAPDGPVGFGKAGSFEGFCSGGGIAQLAKKIVTEKLENNRPVEFCPSLEKVSELDAKTIFLAAQRGDPVAHEIVKISANYLGMGLSVLIDILNPECIVIGSIYERNEELFKPFIEQVLQREAIPSARKVCQIKPAELGDSIGDYAALCVAMYDDKF